MRILVIFLCAVIGGALWVATRPQDRPPRLAQPRILTISFSLTPKFASDFPGDESEVIERLRGLDIRKIGQIDIRVSSDKREMELRYDEREALLAESLLPLRLNGEKWSDDAAEVGLRATDERLNAYRESVDVKRAEYLAATQALVEAEASVLAPIVARFAKRRAYYAERDFFDAQVEFSSRAMEMSH